MVPPFRKIILISLDLNEKISRIREIRCGIYLEPIL